jgi:hypothetical protein
LKVAEPKDFEVMKEKLYIVELTWAEPGTRAPIQPIRATGTETIDNFLWFYKSDGSVAGMFDNSMVPSWRESTEKELERLGREIDAKS